MSGLAMPGIYLKARPFTTQLTDRLATPVPDGMELYIHEDDVAGAPGDERWRTTLADRFGPVRHLIPEQFGWIVEGPVWALDGELFGLGGNRPVDRLLVERLVTLATDLGAWAVNIHAVDGTPDIATITEGARTAAIDRAVPFLTWFVKSCTDAGLVALIENVPPICRMRRGAYIFTPHGVEPEDLRALVAAVPGLRVTLDTSHAQLAVNALRGVPAPSGVPDSVARAGAIYRERGETTGIVTLDSYVKQLLDITVSAHISNARGLLDEGNPYDDGDVDLDPVVRLLAPAVRSFVTEPLDLDEDRATEKRRMQQSLARALGRPQ